MAWTGREAAMPESRGKTLANDGPGPHIRMRTPILLWRTIVDAYVSLLCPYTHSRPHLAAEGGEAGVVIVGVAIGQILHLQNAFNLRSKTVRRRKIGQRIAAVEVYV